MSTNSTESVGSVEWLQARRDWLRVLVVPGLHGGWDVVLRVDGTYAGRRMAEHMARHVASVLTGEIGVPVPSSVTPDGVEGE